MPAKLIDGKAVSAQIREELKQRIAALQAKGITPGLAVVLVGDNPASKVYVGNQVYGNYLGCELSPIENTVGVQVPDADNKGCA